MTKIVDLDQFSGEPIEVVANGATYLLPADLPIPTVIRIEQLAANETDPDANRKFYEEVLALFQVHQPELEDLPLNVAQLANFIPTVYGGGTEDPTPPRPARAKAGTKKQTRRPKPRTGRSRSSRS